MFLTNEFIIWLSLILSVYLTILFDILLMLHVFNLTMCLTESLLKNYPENRSFGKKVQMDLVNSNLVYLIPLDLPFSHLN